ncbi:site-specific integrase [Acetobacter sp. DmW_043]|uniref:site-specific integrase n=1 Tax=Acetobacter sp. DmW_043 TaxID=1670658 RepID=UPI001E3B67A1|nr:site-specific integrase [Acetobacter sp. DmW_043]
MRERGFPGGLPSLGTHMLRLIGSHYHFRRAVPVALQACLGKTEISLSLQTDSKFLARQRAAALYARTGEVFHKARAMQGRFSERELASLLTFQSPVTLEPEGIAQEEEATSAPKRKTMKPRGNLTRKVVRKPRSSNKKLSALMLSEALEQFILSNPRASTDTRKATKRTVALYIRAFGDTPVSNIGGSQAGAFRDLLLALPATLGKGKSSLTLQQEAQRTREGGLPTLSNKSVKNHMLRLSALWNQLVQRELVAKNPWAGWHFESAPRTVRKSWTARELALLTSASWHSSLVPEPTFRLVTLIAAYTGMRLGEICTLRKEDLQTIEGVPCFMVRPHSETGWAPKTEAGTRVIPVHSKLIKAGVLSLRDNTESAYLIPGLDNSGQKDRGATLSRAFSQLKTRLGLPAEITFHSFRHTVSTQLRNADANIREVWIDHLLGHEATHKSQGTTTYLTGISTANLRQTVEAISYPETAFKKIPF